MPTCRCYSLEQFIHVSYVTVKSLFVPTALIRNLIFQTDKFNTANYLRIWKICNFEVCYSGLEVCAD